MNPFKSYQITHINLNDVAALPPSTHQGQGNYIVFWWKDIALGHLFLKPDQMPTEEEYHKELVDAITPAIQLYATSNSLLPISTSWQGWLMHRDFRQWDTWMNSIFSIWHPNGLPEQLPVSIIVCTSNRAAMLRRCLLRLQRLSYLPTEIIVVDNSPLDNSTQEITQEFPGVVYVREPRVGLDIARNTGIRTAHCPIVAFIDDDVVVHPMHVYRVWETFEDTAVAAMTGLIIASHLETEAQLIFEQHWSFNRGYVDKLYTSEYILPIAGQVSQIWRVGAGANMAFRKSVFERVGYFDELLDAGAAGCNGDSELWYRILHHGFHIRYNPRATVYHEHRREIKDLKRQLFYYMRGHAAATLIQGEPGHMRYLYHSIPINYAYHIRAGFPFFRFRSRTLWAELRGVASGIIFYYRHRNRVFEHLP